VLDRVTKKGPARERLALEDRGLPRPPDGRGRPR
jgi:hypothetical protein